MSITNLPVDLAFAVATTATADLLANRATTDVSAGAGGNGALKELTDDGFTLAALSIVIPTADFWVGAYNLEVDTPCVVQLGYLNAAGSTFTAIDTHVCTTVAAGGIVKNTFQSAGLVVPLLTSSIRFALRVSSYGAETAVRVSGNIELIRAG